MDWNARHLHPNIIQHRVQSHVESISEVFYLLSILARCFAVKNACRLPNGRQMPRTTVSNPMSSQIRDTNAPMMGSYKLHPLPALIARQGHDEERILA